jgi:MarR family transcriptional regulator, transcriptional regulator for hemolysin
LTKVIKNVGLEQSIGFVMNATARRVSLLLSHRLKEHGISPEQWSVLYHVAEREGMIQKEIAEKSSRDRPTVTRILDALEARELVYKKPGETDRRSFLVYATPSGKALIEQTSAIEYGLNEEIMQAIGEEEYGRMLDLLNQINRYVEPYLKEQVRERD